jgi:anti-sigma28 factor (negative regulator of flagellin synthesis)
MEIKNATSARGLGAAETKTPTEAVERRVASDRVSTLDAHRAADAARGAQAKVGEMRLVRLVRIGEAIRSGNYQPSASQVANRLLDAAEIDQHLKVILGG